MNPYEHALQEVARILDDQEIAWAVTGSLALGHHGVVRATEDIDLKVLLQKHDPALDEVALAVGRRHRVLDEALYEIGTVLVELYPLDGRIDRMALERRIDVPLFLDSDTRYWVITAEDLILSKLREHQRHGGAKHLDDVRRLVAVRHADLDMDHLHGRLDQEGLLDIWMDDIEGHG